MTSDNSYSTGKQSKAETPENKKRCQAITTKGYRCKKEAAVYCIYEGDRLEYLSCKLHFQYFEPHPMQPGQQPPQEEG